ncbi:MAG: cytochrome c oxidase assembly protein [Actinomycetota bacterium]
MTATALSVQLRWNADPVVITALVLGTAVYARGLRELWRRGAGRGVSSAEAIAFFGGLLVVAAALLSPIDSLAASLFWAHMCQHMLLIVVAAPLIVLGRPLLVMPRGLPPSWRRGLHGGRPGRNALPLAIATWIVHTVVVWAWHLPAFFQAALANPAVHALEHAMFLATALAFWWWLIDPAARRSIGGGVAVAYAIAAGVQGMILGSLMLFSEHPWYPAYAAGARGFGLTPLQDQQLAGLVMWIPPGIVYLVAAALLFLSYLRAVERDTLRSEARALSAAASANGHVREAIG